MKEPEHDNETLTTRLKDGDEHAFRVIYDRYHHRLFQYSLRFTQSTEATQEIIQDVFLTLWTHRQSLQPTRSLQNYLYTLNKHENFKFLQRAARQATLQREIIARYETQRNPTEEAVIYQEYMDIAGEAVDHLPAQRQLIFRMFRFEGRSSQEIAALLGISHHTVRAQLVKATQYIKKQFRLRTGITLTLLGGLLKAIG